MVPQHHAHLFGRIVCHTPAQKIRKRRSRAHVGAADRSDLDGLPVLDQDPLVGAARTEIVFPGIRAAALHDKPHIASGTGIDHLHHVVSRHAVIRFEVRSAEIDKDRPCALRAHRRDLRKLGPRDRHVPACTIDRQRQALGSPGTA